VVSERLETFSNLSNDGSGLERKEQFEKGFNVAIHEVMGQGIGIAEVRTGKNPSASLRIDNTDMGFLMIPISLGWVGTIPYIGGILLLLTKLLVNLNSYVQKDTFAISARAIAIASLLRVFTTSIIISEYALPIWLFLGIGMAACKYQQACYPGKDLSGSSRA
jgi:hypothetical protein